MLFLDASDDNRDQRNAAQTTAKSEREGKSVDKVALGTIALNRQPIANSKSEYSEGWKLVG
jgi:hypothetical protein